MNPEIRKNVIAGLSTAVVLVPQSLAYAMLAGLPPVQGLYAAFLPLLVYALLGTSPVLAVGPTAMDSILVAAGVAGIAAVGSANYIQAATTLAGMVGIIFIVFGLLRGGFAVNFLSRPVISGFTSAAALIIAANQLPHLLGMDISGSTRVWRLVETMATNLDQINTPTLAVGVSSVVLLVILRTMFRAFPRSLAIVALFTIASAFWHWESIGIAIVGEVPSGLPRLSFELPSWIMIQQLAGTALTIAVVAYTEAISIAKAYENSNMPVRANRELIALGSSNLAAFVSGGYPVTAGFSRTAVNANAGASAKWVGMITAAVVGLVLVALAPGFYYLPKAALAAIIIVAVLNLVDLTVVNTLSNVKRADMWLLLLTFFATLGIGMQTGLLVGVLGSLAWFIIKTTKPHFAVLGKLPDSNDYRNIKNFPEAETIPGILILRIDAQLYFGNASFLKSTLRKLEAEQTIPLHTVILEACSVNQLDSTAVETLKEILCDYQSRGIELLFASVKQPVKKVMLASGFCKDIGDHHFFLNIGDAVCCTKERQAC